MVGSCMSNIVCVLYPTILVSADVSSECYGAAAQLRITHIDVWQPAVLSTRNHSSLDSFPSPSLSAREKIFRIWGYTYPAPDISLASSHLFSVLGVILLGTISDSK